MSFKNGDRCRMTSSTTGLGDMTLVAATVGFQNFSAVLSDGDLFAYNIDSGSGDWENGFGTYHSAGPSFSRTTVKASSNSNAAVSFLAGTKTVWIGMHKACTPVIDNNGKLVLGSLAYTFPGTSATLARIDGQNTFTATQTISGANTRMHVINTSGTTSQTSLGADSALSWVGSLTNNDFYFSTNNVEQMRLSPGVGLLVGYTTSNGAFKLQVNSQIFATSATIATSHGPYKDNQQVLTGGLAAVRALTPKTFTWKQGCGEVLDESGKVLREAHNFPTGTQVGFVAQDIVEALKGVPWLAAIVKSNCRAAPRDAEGNTVGEAENFLGVAEGNLIAILVSAIKELDARLTAAGFA